MAIANAQLIATDKTVVFDATGENAITCMIFCNTSSDTDSTISVWVVPAAQPAGPANMVIKDVLLPAGETFSMDTERFILSDSDTIQAQASQDTIVTVTVSYVQTG